MGDDVDRAAMGMAETVGYLKGLEAVQGMEFADE